MSKINSKIKSGFAPINGASIFYEMKGKGDALVFVHAMGLDCRMWDDQFLEFAKYFQVIRYDQRGYGKSSLPTKEPYSHHEDLYALLDYLKVGNANLIGLSMGGRIVIDFALMFPDRSLSLILADTVVHGYVFKTFSLEKVFLAAKESGIEGANKAWVEHELCDSAKKIPAVARALKTMNDSYSGWHWVNKNPWIPLVPPAIEQLDKLKNQTLIIIGQLDLPDFHSMADILSEKIVQSQKIEIPNVGHMSNMENPNLFNKKVLEFLLNINQPLQNE